MFVMGAKTSPSAGTGLALEFVPSVVGFRIFLAFRHHGPQAWEDRSLLSSKGGGFANSGNEKTKVGRGCMGHEICHQGCCFYNGLQNFSHMQAPVATNMGR